MTSDLHLSVVVVRVDNLYPGPRTDAIWDISDLARAA